MIRSLLLLGFPLALSAASSSGLAGDASVKVEGNGHRLGPTPVLVGANKLEPGEYVLSSGKDEIPATVVEDCGCRHLAFVLPGLGADEEREFSLKKRDGGAAAGIGIAERGKDVEITVGGEPWATLRNGEGAKPFLYPLLGPGGLPLTRSYPMEDKPGEERDHPHQRSFWFTHGNVNGVDFWSESGKNGTIRESKRIAAKGGSALGIIRTANDWIKPGGGKVCEDERVLRFWAAGPVRILDFDVSVKATEGPVTFGDTKEGSFGVRVATTMDVDRKKGGRIVNAEGLADKDAWAKASAWVDYSGPAGGKPGGIAILNHPESFRYPTTWHVRTYGLFAANPFGWKDFGRKESGNHTIPEGETMTLRYRLILHGGDAAEGGRPDIAAAFAGYAKPPRVTVASE